MKELFDVDTQIIERIQLAGDEPKDPECDRYMSITVTSVPEKERDASGDDHFDHDVDATHTSAHHTRWGLASARIDNLIQRLRK